MRKFAVFFVLFAVGSSGKARDFDRSDIATMRLEDKVGQMIMLGINGKNAHNDASLIIKRFRIGGIILFRYNIGTPAEISELTASIQKNSMEILGLPAFISTDQENGQITRIKEGVTRFPGNMALGSADDVELTQKVAYITGRELVSLGINMNLAPCSDINSNPLNPVINTRSFGSDPDKVALHTGAYIRGLQSAGCMAVAKHFPGHGNTVSDSHKALPVVNADLASIENFELVPFKSAVKERCSGIMSAHISFPKVVSGGVPATLSPFFMKDELRGRLKFEGLSITDDLEMGAISQNLTIAQAAVRAVESGADIVLTSARGDRAASIHRAIVSAVKSGRISESRIDESVARILSAKEKFLVNFQHDAGGDYDSSAVLRRLCRKALYLRGEYNAPAAEKNHVAVTDSVAMRDVLVSGGWTVYALKDYKKALSSEASVIALELSSPRDAAFKAVTANAALAKKCIIVYTGNPFLLSSLKNLPAVLFTFSALDESMVAASEFLCGKFKVSTSISIDIFPRADN